MGVEKAVFLIALFLMAGCATQVPITGQVVLEEPVAEIPALPAEEPVAKVSEPRSPPQAPKEAPVKKETVPNTLPARSFTLEELEAEINHATG
ncbi:MAG: hypothetical protein Q7S65_06080, partial [Nanoarchaeota archaeon]|nr:hypothetical protein [Nanoarchaeota archaeon]